jgi:hypothetical protein
MWHDSDHRRSTGASGGSAVDDGEAVQQDDEGVASNNRQWMGPKGRSMLEDDEEAASEFDLEAVV